MRYRSDLPVRHVAVLVLLAACLVWAAPAEAQRDAVVAGRIVDTEGNPIAGATVSVYSPDRGDTRTLETDEEGNFIGRGFRTDVHVIRVEAEGYATLQMEADLDFGMNTIDGTLEAAGPSIDYDMVNGLYQDGFAAYERGVESGAAADWAAAEEAMAPVVEAIAELEGEEVVEMRLSALEILARAQLEQDKVDAALATYDRLLELDPDSLAGHSWKARALVARQDFDNAMPHLRRAAELAQDDPATQYNAGAIMLQVGQVEEGIALIERAIELRPDFALAKKQLGYAYLRLGGQDASYYEKAVTQLREYLELSPDAADRAEVEGMISALEAQIQAQ